MPAFYRITPEIPMQGRTREAATAMTAWKKAAEQAGYHRQGIEILYARIVEVKEDSARRSNVTTGCKGSFGAIAGCA